MKKQNADVEKAYSRLVRQFDRIEMAAKSVSVASVENLSHRVEELMHETVQNRKQTQDDFMILLRYIQAKKAHTQLEKRENHAG